VSEEYLDQPPMEVEGTPGVSLGVIIGMIIALGVIVAAILSMEGKLPRFAIIQTESMKPTLQPGDIVMVTPVDPSQLKPGDIIAFNLVAYDYWEEVPKDFRKIPLTTHRIIEVKEINGTKYFRTAGDYIGELDPWIVPARGVLGKAEKIGSLGALGLAITQPIGRILLIVIMLASLGLLSSTLKTYSEGTRENLERFM